MDDFESKIKKVFSRNVKTPIEYDNMVMKTLNEKCKRKENMFQQNKFIRILATTFASVILTTGIVFAGYNICKNIWKKPNPLNYNDLETLLEKQDIDIVETKQLITEENVCKKAIEVINNLGYKDESIQKVKLNKTNNITYYDIHFIGNNNIYVKINGKTGKLMGISIIDNFYNNIEKISVNTASKYAESIVDKLGLDLENYMLQFCNENYAYNKSQNYKIWVATFNKKYDTRYNPYECIEIHFYVVDNEIKIEAILVKEDETFNNNDIIITEENAKKIAIDKENTLSQLDIMDVNAKLAIERMNTYIYELEYDINTDNKDLYSDVFVYDIGNTTRNVWIIEIHHNDIEFVSDDTLENKKQWSKKYYIDATTGEIIGGANILKKDKI